MEAETKALFFSLHDLAIHNAIWLGYQNSLKVGLNHKIRKNNNDKDEYENR